MKRLLPVTLLVLLALAHLHLVYGHGDPAGPTPVTANMRPLIGTAEPLRWSWLHWWEANRELYLMPLTQGRRVQDRQHAGEWRTAAVEALLAALNDPAPVVRRAASVSLGLMREASANIPLQTMIGTPNAARDAALLGVGLIGRPDGQQFLIDTNYKIDASFIAAIRGLGGAEMLIGSAKTGLMTMPVDRPPITCPTVWALAQHMDHMDRDEAREIERIAIRTIKNSESPWLVNEALLALSRARSDEAHAILASVAINDGRADQLPAWLLLESMEKEKKRLIGAARKPDGTSVALLQQQWNVVQDRLLRTAPWPTRLTGPRAPARPGLTPAAGPFAPMVKGLEEIFRARLRISAAIALGRLGNRGAAAPLLKLLNENAEDYNTTPKGFAAIALGELGARQGLSSLMDIVDASRARQTREAKYLDSPLRGFAAIALGLYARAEKLDQGSRMRPGADRAIELLGARMIDPAERSEVRSACAVALGLTRRTELLKGMIEFTSALTPNDRPLIGYVLLARAMLGDQSMLVPTQRLLELPAGADEMTEYLTLRAGILGLGLRGGEEVIPVLAQAWHLPYYVNREVVLALALCNAEGVCREVIPELQNAANANERAYMATVLGWLFTEFPSPLSGVLANSNFTLRDESRRAYANIVNEFLFAYLVPSFGKVWF